MGWIKVSEARRRLNNAVSVQSLYNLLRRGKVRGTQIGGIKLIDEDSLADLIRRGEIGILTRKVPNPTR